MFKLATVCTAIAFFMPLIHFSFRYALDISDMSLKVYLLRYALGNVAFIYFNLNVHPTNSYPN